MKITQHGGGRGGAGGYSGGASSVAYYDQYGVVTPERAVLQEILAIQKENKQLEAILATLKRIEEKL